MDIEKHVFDALFSYNNTVPLSKKSLLLSSKQRKTCNTVITAQEIDAKRQEVIHIAVKSISEQL